MKLLEWAQEFLLTPSREPSCKADIRNQQRVDLREFVLDKRLTKNVKSCPAQVRLVMSFNYVMFINPLALDSCRRALIILDRDNIFPPRQRSSNKQARPLPRWNSFKPLLTTVEKIFDF